MTATVRIPEDQLVYEPGVLVLPHGGVLELTLINDDKNTHCAVLPSNGDTQFIWLVNHSKGTATLARALRKNYRQESPLDWGYMTFSEPRRERVRLTTRAKK